MVYCTECGQKCPDAAKFCMHCGTNVLQATPNGRPGNVSFYEAFRTFDKDGNGILTAEELVGILTRQGGGKPMSLMDAKLFVAYFDADHNGGLDYKEFCAAMGQPVLMGGVPMGAWELPDGNSGPGTDAVAEAVPVADMASSNTTMNSSTTTTTNNVTAAGGPVNIVGGDQYNSQVFNWHTEVHGPSEAELRRRNALEERKRQDRARERDAEREAQRQRQRRQAEEQELARRRKQTNSAVGLGATIGFFAAGPLGAAIGGYYGNKHAKKRIDQHR